ncbi:MAG TPA: capsule assembly Wzi family protein [Lunatimonas sp.]|nr:capsule assembly Wzi family protein [Lunatimonas sp.]
MNRAFKLLVLLLLVAINFFSAIGQSLSLNQREMEDYLRREQLLGKTDSTVSLMIRPLYPQQSLKKDNGIDLDGTFTDEDLSKINFRFLENKGRFRVLPVMWRTQYNSNFAFGLNDASMIPNRGLQHLLSLGVYGEYGPISIQLQPEFIHAANRDFQGFPTEHYGITWKRYYEWLNTSDIPERFGTSPYTRLLPGQSSIRFNHKELSIGISTENLWWGPARRSSLLMSNHAPGFLHATINTREPINTPIGKFETQLIAGRLEDSGFAPPQTDFKYGRTPIYVPKRESQDWRYISGFVLSYQPTWVPGLFLGFSSVSQMYSSDMSKFGDFLPLFNSQKGPESVSRPDVDKRNQLSAGYFRWISPKGRFEFYGEYGSNGNSRSLHDFLINPDLNRAFSFGLTHLIPLKKQDAFMQVGMEITQTGQTIRENILAKKSWYTHPHVRHGYTHRGQVIGFGYGPGSNVISAELAWVRNFNKIGFQLEYINNNNDFYYFTFEESKDWRSKYVDIIPGVVAEWRVSNLLLSASAQFQRTLNYKWYLRRTGDQYFVPGLDKNNTIGRLSATYIFK